MRFSTTTAILALFALAASGSGQEKTPDKNAVLKYFHGDWFGQEPLSIFVSGKVLDVFEANRLLLSRGASHGAKKGWVMEVYRLDPEPLYLGRVEFVEVGAKHSIGRYRGRGEVRENDLFAVRSPVMPKFEWPGIPGGSGGAIIDLSR